MTINRWLGFFPVVYLYFQRSPSRADNGLHLESIGDRNRLVVIKIATPFSCRRVIHHQVNEPRGVGACISLEERRDVFFLFFFSDPETVLSINQLLLCPLSQLDGDLSLTRIATDEDQIFNGSDRSRSIQRSMNVWPVHRARITGPEGTIAHASKKSGGGARLQSRRQRGTARLVSYRNPLVVRVPGSSPLWV